MSGSYLRRSWEVSSAPDGTPLGGAGKGNHNPAIHADEKSLQAWLLEPQRLLPWFLRVSMTGALSARLLGIRHRLRKMDAQNK